MPNYEQTVIADPIERKCMRKQAIVKMQGHLKVVLMPLKTRAVMSNMLQWMPSGSQMPDETGCRFAQVSMMINLVFRYHDAWWYC